MKHTKPKGSAIFKPSPDDKRSTVLFRVGDTVLIGRWPESNCGSPRPIRAAETIDMKALPRVVVSLADPYLPAA